MEVRNLNTKRAVLGLALAAVCATAAAAVTFDPATFTGQVGKGDVQTPFGYNNHAMQLRHTHVTFTYVEAEEFSQSCYEHLGRGEFEWRGYRTRTSSLRAAIDPHSRLRGQWVGWVLNGPLGEVVEEHTGWGPGTTNGCPAGTTPQGSMVRTAVGNGLYAHDVEMGKRALIWHD